MKEATALDWLWRQVEFPAGTGGGASLVIAAKEAVVGIFVARPAGDAVDAVLVGGGRLDTAERLPLMSVSGAAPSVEGFLVAGAASDGTTAMACTVDLDRGRVATVPLPGAGSVSAWPVVAGTDPPTVAWVEGRSPSTLRYGTLQQESFKELGHIAVEGVVWSMEADRAGAAVLCQTPGGGVLVELPAGGTDDPAIVHKRVFPSGARLSAGVVAHAASLQELEVWEVPGGDRHQIRLPRPAGEGSNRTASPLLTCDPDLVIWSTLAADIRPVEDAPAAQVILSRGWSAPLDRAEWHLGPVTELPIAPVSARTAATYLVIADTTSVWIAERNPAFID